MFLFRADRILEELSAHEPEILRATEQAFEAAVPSAHGGIDLPLALYEKIPSAPIDKAVMERATRIAVVPCDPDWTDLGSWQTIWEQSARDDRGNATYGDVLLNDAENCLVHTSHRLVACAGVRDLAIIETDDALLITDRQRSEPVKAVVASLNAADRSEAIQHSAIEHDWGRVSTLANGASAQVRRLEVGPGQAADYPEGQAATLHWLIIEGTADLRRGDRRSRLETGQSADLPANQPFSLRNVTDAPLTIIEITRPAAPTG
jgi:mannose-1-phosphate guanylyltransferase/mannose-6-phosphate isomerase